jgi:hypothetical protein
MQATEPVVIRGVVRDGVVVPDETERLIEGARVGIVLTAATMTSELAVETAAWERVSDGAWAMIAGWERETAP